MAKNVLLTTLSTLDFERAKLSAYFYEENTGGKKSTAMESVHRSREVNIYYQNMGSDPDRCGGYKANDK